LSGSQAAGLETEALAQQQLALPGAVPFAARTGRSVAGKALLLFPNQLAAVVFPPEPPVATYRLAQRPAVVQGAPFFGAAQRTLDGEDGCATAAIARGGSGGKTTLPAGELGAI